MGVSLVARVEGMGLDAFQLIADRLLCDHQALPKERWISAMRSFRQPVPPLEPASNLQLPEDELNTQNRSKKQRSMYCFRHSARPSEFVAMIEDSNAPKRPFHQKTPQDLNSSATNLIPTQNMEAPIPSITLESFEGMSGDKMQVQEKQSANQQPADVTATAITTTQLTGTNQSGSINVEESKIPAAPKSPRVTPPSHYRLSLISVPESFEPLLSSAICAPQANLIPSAWCPRPNYVAIEGMTWGVHSSSFELDPTPSSLAPTSLHTSGKEMLPDWWIRLGTVTNKGATTGNTSLPWLILEIECASSPVEFDPSFAFLESVMRTLIKPNENLVVRPYRPTLQNLVEAGLMSSPNNPSDAPHPIKSATLRNSYCMLMLAKEESLI